MIDETLTSASVDLAEPCGKFKAARAWPLAAGGECSEDFRAAMARLERIEAELKRVEVAVAWVGLGWGWKG